MRLASDGIDWRQTAPTLSSQQGRDGDGLDGTGEVLCGETRLLVFQPFQAEPMLKPNRCSCYGRGAVELGVKISDKRSVMNS